ncbi:MAG: PadR family transcriptional regulator [Thermoleophilia bacterium]|nr:PadR family transcriptional regulator [Thermoleophilia bacterium]
MTEVDDILAAQIQELRRGTIVLACLRLLEEPQYGYSLLSTLEQSGFPVEGNTLYPLLRRLEKQGLLTSEWSTTEARPRKYYRVSQAGREVAARLLEEWERLRSGLDLLSGPRGTSDEHDR